MSGIAIYMEGGGDGASAKAALRQGMDTLLEPLKQLARAKSWRWRLVCCGSRNEAHRGFRNALDHGDGGVCILLVDAEGPVNQSAGHHLQRREGWDLCATPEDQIHLMVQAMEAWILADPPALAKYYGQGFRLTALPKTQNLEDVSKQDLERGLRQATEDTSKGRYHKIKHASDLLKRIDVSAVTSRCRHCKRLFEVLGQMIATSQSNRST